MLENKVRRENRRQHYRTVRRYYVNTLKAKARCLKCGENDSHCLIFHHRNPSDKKYEISKMMNSSLYTINKEISKCDILCANCHLKLHRKEIDDKNRNNPKEKYIHKEIVKGEGNFNAKLKNNDIPAIRKLLKDSSSLSGIGRQYGVSKTTICHIRDRKTWAWVK